MNLREFYKDRLALFIIIMIAVTIIAIVIRIDYTKLNTAAQEVQQQNQKIIVHNQGVIIHNQIEFAKSPTPNISNLRTDYWQNYSSID